MDATGTARTPAPDTGAAQGGSQAPGVNVGERERWASLLGGGALVLYGLSRRSPAGVVLALLGGDLLYRGATGHSFAYQALGIDTAGEAAGARARPTLTGPIRVEKSVTINRSPEDLYCYWRRFENLPCFMTNLESVQTFSDGRSHWVAKAPLGASAEWDAEIVEDRENELIAWRSLENADVYNTGSVSFIPAPGGRGTEVKVGFEYSPPGGVVGALFARLFGEEPSQQVAEDLRRFKQMMEAGEIATVEGQTSGREKPDRERLGQGAQPGDTARPKSVVREASEESFPASDAPAWTMRVEDGEGGSERELGR